ncbi:MAG: PIN domain-containing protein [Chloroflexota bacterium]
MTEIEPPRRILLDTNIFILGYLDLQSPEAVLLENLMNRSNITLIFSNDLEEQIRRVGKRLQHKDWVGALLHYIWRSFQVDYVYILPDEIIDVEAISDIPSEDIGIYLTALRGRADCLVSGNHQFVKDAAEKQKKFECHNTESFLQLYFPAN